MTKKENCKKGHIIIWDKTYHSDGDVIKIFRCKRCDCIFEKIEDNNDN